MRLKFFLISFSILSALAAASFISDRFILYRELYNQIDSQLETMATSIIASELSKDLLTNFEKTEDVISDALEDQRLDRSIRVFDQEGRLLFANEIGRDIEEAKSPKRWSIIKVVNGDFRILTIETKQYTLEVGISLSQLLTKTKYQLRNVGFILSLIVLSAGFLSYWISGLVMRPLVRLGGTFSALKELGVNSRDLSKFRESEQLKVLENLKREKHEVGHLARELLAVFAHWNQLNEKHTRDLFFLAHELKTPIAKIVLEVETLKMRNPAGDRLGALDTILDICRALARFVNDYLRVASLRSTRKGDLALTAISLPKAVDEIIQTHFSQTQGRIKFQIFSEITVFAEPLHLQSLVTNLVQNALLYSKGTVTISLAKNGLEIIDSGPGLSEEVKNKLGDAFNKSSEPGSTGLGLALVNTICELYGWRFEYQRRDAMTSFQINFEEPTLDIA